MSDQLALFDVSEVAALTQKLQFPAPFDEMLHRWADNEAAHRAEWTEENLCIAWVTESDGRHHRDWWRDLPAYRRNFFFTLYREERLRADHNGLGRMSSLQTCIAILDEGIREDDRLAQKWADEIKQAAIENLPCPFVLHEDANGQEKMRFETRLHRAFELAGVVIVQAAPPVVKKKGRRRAA